MYFTQTTLVMTADVTVVETVTGLFERRNLTVQDAPLVSIECTNNCGPEMWIVLRRLTIVVRTRS